MNDLLIAVAGLIGIIFGAHTSAFVALYQTQRKMASEHVLTERKNWRDKIRMALTEARHCPSEQGVEQLWLTLKLNTNPFSVEDNALLASVRRAKGKEIDGPEWDEVADRVSLLLKHDWERAKHGTHWFNWAWLAQERVGYKNWQRKPYGGIFFIAP